MITNPIIWIKMVNTITDEKDAVNIIPEHKMTVTRTRAPKIMVVSGRWGSSA